MGFWSDIVQPYTSKELVARSNSKFQLGFVNQYFFFGSSHNLTTRLELKSPVIVLSAENSMLYVV